ncbi:hypothetical protein GV828_10605 [Flavobacterium sp. NST-5]|uniref:Uncharacterized protein n=1 Tax=Flavobacterium ichthyis TaxID=2698827 RepID=A0ABW9ZC10_9FLAO|nr:hypothetical protein [Flavobacterium ichthyis]NBL65651.1 hypothetical protein [Flavobacterium ichthyis]
MKSANAQPALALGIEAASFYEVPTLRDGTKDKANPEASGRPDFAEFFFFAMDL